MGKIVVQLYGGPLDGAMLTRENIPPGKIPNTLKISTEDPIIVVGDTYILPHHVYRKDKTVKKIPYKYVYDHRE